MANLKRLVEVSSMLTVLIFFITELQSQSLEISVKRGKQRLKQTPTNQQKTCVIAVPLVVKLIVSVVSGRVNVPFSENVALMNSSEESELNKIDKELLEYENEFLDSALHYFEAFITQSCITAKKN
jgi:hypothetical protein